MKKQYMDFVPSKVTKRIAQPVQKQRVVIKKQRVVVSRPVVDKPVSENPVTQGKVTKSGEKMAFSSEKEPKLGMVEELGPKFVEYITSRRIIPGIKVDQGLEKIKNSEETYTKGLENLPNRLQEYYQMGLRFAKWRAAFLINPSEEAINKNCEILAEYAKACQNFGLVPIVEPELLYDGNYSIEQSAESTSKILSELFSQLVKKEVNLRACILKANMVLAGKKSGVQSTSEEVGAKTAEVLKNHVPTELAGVAFLSGGQTPEQATDNLSAILKNGPFPWPVTFSFARALQSPVLETWQGNNDNIKPAQESFLDRLEKNQIALRG